MPRRIARETALVLTLTLMLLVLAASVGLPGRSTPERTEASGRDFPVVARPQFVERP